jgi:hypothetical protein
VRSYGLFAQFLSHTDCPKQKKAKKYSKSSFAMWIIRLALRRPYMFVVLALLITVLGILSTVTMPTGLLLATSGHDAGQLIH